MTMAVISDSLRPLNVLALPIAIASFLLPGWLVTARIPAPTRPVAAFLASAAIFFNAVLLLSAVGVPLNLGTIAAALALVSALLAWKVKPRPGPVAATAAPSPRRAADWFYGAAALAALASIATRAIIDPLSGYDTFFRWDYLPRLMIAQESLHAYPPVTAGDFELYGWCDGIPPLVPLLHFWIYSVCHSTAPVLIAARVVGEALLLGGVAAALAQRLWGPASGPAALGLLGAGALVPWSIAMGQETGLTTLTFLAVIYYLVVRQETPSGEGTFWVALAAGVGALTREYGLAFAGFAFVVLLAQRAPRRQLLLFVGIVVAVAAPWYLRNWILTGNPVYPQSFGGLFPTNSVYTEHMRVVANEWGLRTSPYPRSLIPQFLAALAIIPAVAGLFGLLHAGWRNAAMFAGGIAVIAGLWLISLPQTAGGWVYASRVLAPAVALAAVLGAVVVRLPKRVPLACAIIVFGFALDAARRSWFLPVASMASPWPYSFQPWRAMKAQVAAFGETKVWSTLTTAAGGQGIVLDHPNYHATVVRQGGRAIPLFSPQLAETLGSSPAFSAVLQNLHQAGIRFIVLDLNNSMTRAFITAHPFWSKLCQERPDARTPAVIIYDLNRLAPSAAK